MQNSSWQDRLAALRSTMGADADDDSTAANTTDAPAPATTPAKEGARLDIVFERKGRGGKCATIITGFTMPDDDIAELASAMKRRLGTGGSARGGEILVQGDRRADALAFLKANGYKARVI